MLKIIWSYNNQNTLANKYSDADLRIKMHKAVIIQDEVIKADKVIRELNELENFKRSQKKAFVFWARLKLVITNKSVFFIDLWIK